MVDEGVEVRRKEGPDGGLVVKIAVAARAEVDEVFEGVEIEHVDEAALLEVVVLERGFSGGGLVGGGEKRTRTRSGLAMTRVTCLPYSPQSQHLPLADAMTRSRVTGSISTRVLLMGWDILGWGQRRIRWRRRENYNWNPVF